MLTTQSRPALLRALMAVGGLLVAALACSPLGRTEIQPAIPVPPPTMAPVEVTAAADEGAPPEIGSPPPQTGPSEGPPLGEQMTAQGPWLLFGVGEGLASDGLWVVNADGSGVYVWNTQPGVATNQLARGVSPDGRLVAYIGSPGSSDPFTSPTLFLDRLPDTVGILNAPLYGPGETDLEAIRAIVEQPNLAWSPVGRQLAFMGAMDGPSSDLYVYSLDTREITRLTDGPSQGFKPTWSPDGRWIVHAGASTFGTGAGYSMEGVWAAAADGTAVETLYDPQADFNSSDEDFIGWANDSTFLAHSWDPLCGRRDIRTHDIASAGYAFVWNGYFSDVAYSPDERALLVTVDKLVADCPFEGGSQSGPGAYLIALDGSGAMKVFDGEAHSPVWSDVGAFYAVIPNSVVQITPSGDGNVSDMPVPTLSTPLVSPGGAYWLWSARFDSAEGGGLWAGEYGQPPTQVTSDLAGGAVWSPDGDRFAYVSGGNLYVAAAPSFAPVLAQGADGVQASSLVWAAGSP